MIRNAVSGRVTIIHPEAYLDLSEASPGQVVPVKTGEIEITRLRIQIPRNGRLDSFPLTNEDFVDNFKTVAVSAEANAKETLARLAATLLEPESEGEPGGSLGQLAISLRKRLESCYEALIGIVDWRKSKGKN
jgi:hypothetical protein